jgi:[ribosomal protein S5]-alanine N-acetyltransferase
VNRTVVPRPEAVELAGERCLLRPLASADAQAMCDLRLRNREFFRPWEPLAKDSHFTLSAQRRAIEGSLDEWAAGREYGFGIFDTEAQLVGRIRLTAVYRAAWQNANVGYYVDRERNGRGFATEAVGLVTRFAFDQAGLHRVQAAVMPHNVASVRVLEKNGFRREGVALRYLHIAGTWEDHIIYARTAED